MTEEKPEIRFQGDPMHDEDCMCDDCIQEQQDLEDGKIVYIMVKDMRCCGNCKNQDVNDGGSLQCFDEKHLSDYNGVTSPNGVCEDWEFDDGNFKNRMRCINNSCEETTDKPKEEPQDEVEENATSGLAKLFG